MTDLTWVLSSCVLIGVVAAVRAAFGRRMRPALRYALWGLVLLRLLIPVQLFTAPWGVSVELPERAAEQEIHILPAEPAVIAPSVQAAEPPAAVAPAELPAAVEPWEQTPVDGAPAHYAAAETARRADGRSVAELLRAVWLAGVGVTAAVFLASNLHLYIRLRGRRRPLETDCPLRVYSVENISSSCLFGNAIYVGAETAPDESRLRHVLAHELSHYRHGDCVWTLLRGVALVLHWYNPLVWWAAALARQDSELCADAGALDRLGEDAREDYGATLIELSARRAPKASLLCTATAMSSDKRSLRERVTMIARRPRMTAAVAFAVLALSTAAAGCAFAGAQAEATPTEPENEPAAEQAAASGAYASVEDYLDAVRAQMTTATYYDGSGEKTANVLDTRVAVLDKDGELTGLAPDGTLKLYNYLIETKIDVPLAEVALAGGMYATEDGWCDLEGQGGHSLVILLHADGSVDALFDRPNNDDRGGLYYYEENAKEILYDFYVKENRLDLPLCTINLPVHLEGGCPARRWDGDGWYVYIPVQAWSEASSGGTARWVSRYGTGSSISIRQASHEEMEAEGPQLTEGQAERFVEAPDGRVFLVWTQYDPALLIRSDMAGLEPTVLEAMAESFTVIADSAAQEQTQSAASQLRTLLDSVCDAAGNGEPITLRLRPVYGESAVDSAGDEDARTCGNFRFYMNYLFRSVDVSFTPAELPAIDENAVELTIQSTGDRLRFWEGTNDLLWIDRGGTEQGFRMVYAAGDTVAGDLMREWYDEAEFNALGGDYRRQDELFIPDRGQSWLEAAQEFCERFESIHLQASPGSKCRYAFVRPVVEAAEEETAHFRSIGRIGEDTWCFFLSTAFVPENERALNWSMAGNTGDYTGSDPDVPAGAYEYYRCGYVHRVPGGWRCEIVGTGW